MRLSAIPPKKKTEKKKKKKELQKKKKEIPKDEVRRRSTAFIFKAIFSLNPPPLLLPSPLFFTLHPRSRATRSPVSNSLFLAGSSHSAHAGTAE